MKDYETRPERLIRELVESLATASPDVVAMLLPRLPELPGPEDPATAW